MKNEFRQKLKKKKSEPWDRKLAVVVWADGYTDWDQTKLQVRGDLDGDGMGDGWETIIDGHWIDLERQGLMTYAFNIYLKDGGPKAALMLEDEYYGDGGLAIEIFDVTPGSDIDPNHPILHVASDQWKEKLRIRLASNSSSEIECEVADKGQKYELANGPVYRNEDAQHAHMKIHRDMLPNDYNVNEEDGPYKLLWYATVSDAWVSTDPSILLAGPVDGLSHVSPDLPQCRCLFEGFWSVTGWPLYNLGAVQFRALRVPTDGSKVSMFGKDFYTPEDGAFDISFYDNQPFDEDSVWEGHNMPSKKQLPAGVKKLLTIDGTVWVTQNRPPKWRGSILIDVSINEDGKFVIEYTPEPENFEGVRQRLIAGEQPEDKEPMEFIELTGPEVA